MTLKQSLNLCKRVAKNAEDDRLKYIKIKSDYNIIELSASDSFRVVKQSIVADRQTDFDGFISLEDVKNIITVDDIKTIKAPHYPETPTFKFLNYVDIETDPLRRFCKMHKDNNIDIKIAGRELTLSYRDSEIKTSILIKYTKSNIKYFRTRLNAKLLLEILPKENTIKIKVGKSGRYPISFDDQIIMPVKIKA